MLAFKPIQLSDKEAIDACLEGNRYRACDFCFTNLYAWQAKFKTKFHIEDNTLFVLDTEANGEEYYFLPVGKMPLNHSLELIIKNAEERQNKFMMKGITINMWNDLDKVAPDKFTWCHDRNNDEYMYFSEKLISLQGHKLQSKRNHINRFKRENPDWKYFSLTTQEELNECAAMLDEWEDLNISKAEKSLRYDYIATRIMIDNFIYLGLKGGAIRTNGKIVAFTIGEKLTEDTFVIHVEKAFSQMNGAYTTINQQFVSNEASAYSYINREEDMGLEYLRKAKMSYYPDLLLEERLVGLK